MDFDCPKDKCQNGVCKFLAEPKIGLLERSLKAAMIEANAHLRTFKKAMSKLKFPDPDDAIVHSGIADAVVARIVYDLPVPQKFNDKTVCAALRLIIRELKILCKSNIDNPFDEGESDEEGEQEPGYVLFTDSGYRRKSGITNTEDVSYVSSPYLPTILRGGDDPTNDNTSRAHECAEAKSGVQDELSEAITLDT